MPKLPGLRQARESKFLSQAELAQKAGIARVTIVELESGRAEARWSTSRKIAGALGVEPAALAASPESEPMPPDRDTTTDARDGR